MAPPSYFRFVRKDFIIPPTAWSSFTIAAQTQFHPSLSDSSPTLTRFAWGGYFDDDIVALRTMYPASAKNYSEFSIFERTSDTWSKNFSVTGSDVTTTAGNGVWFVSNESTTSGINGWDHHQRAMDESTTYDSSTNTMYVLAATSSLTSERTFTGTNIYGIPVFKTQKSGDTWSALTEAGLLPTASYQVYPGTGDYATRAIKYMSDGTIATLAHSANNNNRFSYGGEQIQNSVHFTDSTTFKIVDSVQHSDFDPSGINHDIRYWGSIWGTNQSKTKVYVGGTMEGAGLDVDVRHLITVSDVMTSSGEVRAIGRHGVSGTKHSILARSAFEVTVSHLLRAGIIGERDELRGVTENIVVGQPIALGTGSVDLFYIPDEA